MRRWLPRVAVLVFVAVVIIWAATNREQLDPAAIDSWIRDLGILGPVVFALLYIAATVAFLPGLIFSLLGGALFGPVWGSLINLVAATLGASLAFVVARYLVQDWAAEKAGGRLRRMITGVESEGWRFIALVRLVPLFPFNLTNYALGLTRIPLGTYMLTSFICMAPGAVAFTWLGHAGKEALEGNSASIQYGLLALGLLAVIAFVPRLSKQMRKAPTMWTEADALHAKLDSIKGDSLIDVRGPDEFTGPLGHIVGSVNIPLDALEGKIQALRDSGLEAPVMICLTDKRSAAAAEMLTKQGFTNVTVLRGGMKNWNELGFAVAGKTN